VGALDVKVIPGANSDESKLQFDWELIEYSERTMKIQLLFKNAVYVSTFEEENETLEVRFRSEFLFFDQSG